MAFDEVFPRPLVQSVAVEFRFPSLFYLEQKIGEFQIKVMRDFPESELSLKRTLLLTLGDKKTVQEQLDSQSEDAVEKIWQFKSGTGIILAVTSRTLVLSSEKHKSYGQGNERFRDIIAKAIESFSSVVAVPKFTRIGLRYIDKGPVFDQRTETFRRCYDSMLPVERFGLENSAGMDCAITVNRKDCQIRYIESLKREGDGWHLMMDFDAWAENVESRQSMDAVDCLHATIGDEFQRTIKQPIIDYMRSEEGKQ